MPNRREPLNLIDFTGGLNLRRNQFQLEPNESPRMENVTIDPLGGIYTRLGWERWNGPDIVPEGDPWDPRRAQLIQLFDGTDLIYIAANDKVFWGAAPIGATFADLGVTVECDPHMADFATFGDDLYVAAGRNQQTIKRRQTSAPELLVAPGAGSWNDDYLNPLGGKMPAAELIEAHAGYIFVANVKEDGLDFPNRIRWSHPTSPEDWAQLDFTDIEVGGSHITGLMSYEDHLLVFKHDSVWAIYGYDGDSWQVVQKSSTIGATSPQVITRNEQAVFFYSASDRGGVYAYNGERPMEISEPLRLAMQADLNHDLIWVGWMDRRLWVTAPWTYDDGPTADNRSVFVFDPSVGERGAWTYFTAMAGALGPLVVGSNIDSMARPLGVLRSTETPCIVRIDAIPDAFDVVWQFAVLGFAQPGALPPGNLGFIVTDSDPETGAEIIMGGQLGVEPFVTNYRTPWITAGWPTRKKSFRRPDVICRLTGTEHRLQVRSYRDYEELNVKRQHTVVVPSGGAVHEPGQVAAVWDQFTWDDGTLWDQQGAAPQASSKSVASIRRGSSFGLCRALQLAFHGQTVGAKWGIDGIVLKLVMRRFR